MAFADDERDLDETAEKLGEWLSPKLGAAPGTLRIEDLDGKALTAVTWEAGAE